VHKPGTATGDNFTSAEEAILAHHSKRGLLKYKDLEAGYCLACGAVYNVQCPLCSVKSDVYHDSEQFFKVKRPVEARREDGFNWVVVTCRKCDFLFRVIINA